MSHRLLELFYVADIDYSWLAKFLSLLVLPAAHEDIAIVLGGYLVVNQLMPVGIVVVTIYFGMVASDLALCTASALGARRVPWLEPPRRERPGREFRRTRCSAICSGLRRSAGWCPARCS